MTDDIVIESGGVGEGDGDVKVSLKKNLIILKKYQRTTFWALWKDSTGSHGPRPSVFDSLSE